MPIEASIKYGVNKLIPWFPQEPAQRTTVRLAPNLTLKAGQLLEMVTAASEVQTVTGNTGVTAGTYRLSVLGQWTAPLAFNANAAAVQAALQALPAVGAGGITVSGGALSTATAFTLTYAGSLTNTPMPLVGIDVSALTNSGAAIAIAATTQGVSAGTYQAYASGDAKLVLEYDAKSDTEGNIALSQTNAQMEHGETYPTVSAYYGGVFKCSDLIGLDSGAVADLMAVVWDGDTSTGLIRFGA